MTPERLEEIVRDRYKAMWSEPQQSKALLRDAVRTAVREALDAAIGQCQQNAATTKWKADRDGSAAHCSESWECCDRICRLRDEIAPTAAKHEP